MNSNQTPYFHLILINRQIFTNKQCFFLKKCALFNFYLLPFLLVFFLLLLLNRHNHHCRIDLNHINFHYLFLLLHIARLSFLYLYYRLIDVNLLIAILISAWQFHFNNLHIMTLRSFIIILTYGQ